MDEYTGETSQICGGGSRLWQDQYGFTAVQEWIVKIMEKSDFDPTKKGTWPEDCVPVMLYQIADTLRAYESIMSLPVCNTCWKARSCRYRPKPGEPVRINCPLYSPSPHDLEKFKKMIDEPEEKT